MARKRVVEAPSLHSWEDVNDALRQIAEAQIALGEIQSDMQKQILGAQKVAEEQSKPLNDNVAKLEREIKSFVTDHRDEMGKTKSMVLTFGEVGFRLSTSVSLPRAKEKLEEIIRRLKSRQMTDCIVVEEKVSKEALKKYGEDTVNAVGATWKQSDVFGYSKYSSEKDSSPYFFILFRGGIESPAANARPQKTSGTTGHRTAESFIRQWSQGTGVMRHTSWRHSI